MARFITIGSCLANMTGAFLMGDFRWTRLNNVKVDRSDLFIRDFIDRAEAMPPRDEILGFARPKPEHERFFMNSLDAHYFDSIGCFECGADCRPLCETIDSGKIELILMDNMLETYIHALWLDTPSGHRFASTVPFDLCQDAATIMARNPQTTPPLAPADAVGNWTTIIRFFRAVAPRAPIVFLCSPYSLSPHDPERFRRSRDFYLQFRQEADALGVRLLPPLDVDARYTKLPDDDSHFDTVIYKAIAGHVVMCHLGKLTGIGQPYALPDAAMAGP